MVSSGPLPETFTSDKDSEAFVLVRECCWSEDWKRSEKRCSGGVLRGPHGLVVAGGTAPGQFSNKPDARDGEEGVCEGTVVAPLLECVVEM